MNALVTGGTGFLGANLAKGLLERGWQVAPVAGGGWRRVVPSPRPLAVVEQAAVQRLVDDGFCVVAGGGGGVPLGEMEGRLRGVDALRTPMRC